jgi:cyclopropane fatty-acyl-phospholipid synthase-like methyltransferase
MFNKVKSKGTNSNETYKDYTVVRGMLRNYNPGTIDKRISLNETMTGDNYFWVGATAAEAIMAAVMTSRLTDVSRVLDLPCGHGRVLRYLIQLFPDAQFDACDLDNDGVRFCADTFNARPIFSQENLIKVAFDATYDLIWIGSLFTHTSLQVTKQWLAFLAGLLSDNGIIVATFHGRWATRLQKIGQDYRGL